jgi:soluble lytic murein transglycosylase-like protein
MMINQLKIIISSLSSLITLGLIASLSAQLFSQSKIVQPIPSLTQQTKTNPLQAAAIKHGLGDPGEKILKAVQLASEQTGLSQPFILSLMHSESSFKPTAVSSKQYHGLMQIKPAIFYEDVNVLMGARVFLEKLELTKGNVREAIVLYKGFRDDPKRGRMLADRVLRLAKLLKEA